MIAALLLGVAAAPTGEPWVQRDDGALQQLLADAQPPCRSDGVTVTRGRVAAADFYGSMTGFARSAGTTGGKGRTLYLVNRADDPQGRPAAGTLRWAVTEATKAGGGWIGFSSQLHGRTISLASPLRLGSNLTIDGGCAAPRLVGKGRGSILYLRDSQNVVLARLRLEHSGGGADGDCITVSHGADRVWLAFLRLRQCRDGLIDVTRDGAKGPMRITISNSRFADHDKAMLVAGSPLSTPCSLSADPIRLTVARNVFHNTGQRHPRVSGDALVHLKDNVIAFRPRRRANGESGGSYGTLATGGARVVVDRTLYVPPAASRRFRLVADRASSGTSADGACEDGHVEWRRQGSPGDEASRLAFIRGVIRATDMPQG